MIAVSLYPAYVCVLAFISVFLLLAALAGVITLITRAFPAKEEQVDAAVVAAVSCAVQAVWPGAAVVEIQEER